MKQTPQTAPTQSRTVQMGSKNFPKIPIIRSQVLGPIKRPFKASNQPKHYKTLKQSVTSSRIKLLPHGVCQNYNFLVSTRRSTLLSAPMKTYGPIFIDLRKKQREEIIIKNKKSPTPLSLPSVSSQRPFSPFLLIFFFILLLLL